jgi:hypothetical protein
VNVSAPGQDPFALLGLGYGLPLQAAATPAAPAFADTLVDLSSTGVELSSLASDEDLLQPTLTLGEQELLATANEAPALDPATSAAGNAAAAAAAAASPAYAASLAQVLAAQQTLPTLLGGGGSLFDALA